MIIDFCSSAQFQTRLTINDKPIEQVNECSLLGVTLNDSLSWHTNTSNLVSRANKRMTILRHLSSFGIPEDQMIHIYKLYVRSILEQSSVVWASSITESEAAALERCQKTFLRLLYKSNYGSYSSSLHRSGLTTIRSRHTLLQNRFAEKCISNDKTSDIFPENTKSFDSRKSERFHVVNARTRRLANSSQPQMARYLNTKYSI